MIRKQNLGDLAMTVFRFLKLSTRPENTYEVLCVIVFINLLVAFLCLRSWKTVSFFRVRTNATEFWNNTRPLSEPQVLPYPYSYIIPNNKLCNDDNTLLLVILVCTSTENFLQRQTIRETWGSIASSNDDNNNSTEEVRLAFLLGKTSNSILQEKITNESAAFSDIIQADFIDSYQNLTIKSVMLLKWVTMFCPEVQFILKTDDDMYINIENLIESFAKLPRTDNIMFGTLFHEAQPIRNSSSKWFVPEMQFKEKFFPDYLSGTAYGMSGDSVPKLLEASYQLSFLVLEDVFITGLCAEKANVTRFEMGGFNFQHRAPTGCSFRDLISGHHITPTEMKTIWTELQNEDTIC